MQQVELEEIRQKAHKYHSLGKRWHFHVLTPSCVLNEKKQYAFVLECPDNSEILVHYSDQAERLLGEELAPLAHGSKILSKENSTDYKPTAEEKAVIETAKMLNQKGVEWHHHVLSPGCQFNAGSANFTFMFEDPDNGNVAKIKYNQEPTSLLKFIEPLFYKK